MNSISNKVQRGYSLRNSIVYIVPIYVHRGVRTFVGNSIRSSVDSCLGNSLDNFATNPIRDILSKTVKEYNEK